MWSMAAWWSVPIRAEVLRWWSERPWTKFVPSPLLLGTAGLYGGINFTATSLLVVAFVYQVYLRRRHTAWYRKYQYVSTSGVNAGVGLAGLLVVVLTALSAPSVELGPHPNGTCDDVALPALTDEDVACWNQINGYSGCNTPWPSN